MVFEQLNNWFNVNVLLLNFGKKEKKSFICFKKKNAHEINGKLQYENNLLLICQIQYF